MTGRDAHFPGKGKKKVGLDILANIQPNFLAEDDSYFAVLTLALGFCAFMGFPQQTMSHTSVHPHASSTVTASPHTPHK
jgi:hypothetical protein